MNVNIETITNSTVINTQLSDSGIPFEYTSKYGYELKRNGEGSGGFDLITPDLIALQPGQSMKVDTGIRLHLRKGQVALIMARSSWTGLELEFSNAVGLIDWGYCGDDDLIQAIIRKREPSQRVLYSYDISGESQESINLKRDLLRRTNRETQFISQDGQNILLQVLEGRGSSFYNKTNSPIQYKAGEHFAQLLILDTVIGQAYKNDYLSIPNNRGGFGTTDKK